MGDTDCELSSESEYRMFFILPEDIAKRTDISADAKILYAHIMSLSRKSGECFASNGYFAKYYTKSKRAIQRYIQELISVNILESIFLYKENSKEVDRRYLKTNVTISFSNPSHPGDNNDTGGGVRCVTDINTINNNNITTSCEVSQNQPTNEPTVCLAEKSKTIKCEQIHKDIIEYMNEKYGSRYKPETPLTIRSINGWVKKGFKLVDFLKVIDNKFDDWFKSIKYRKYLRPSTLFGGKFEEYLNQIPEDCEPGCVRTEYPMELLSEDENIW